MKAGKHVMEGGLQYIFVYSPHDDVFTALPVPGAKHVAQAVYYHRGDRSISVYELEEGRIDLPNFRFSRILSYRPVSAEKRAQIFETHSIRAQVVGDRKHVLDMIATDVEIFANKEVPKQTRWTSIDSVAELVPNTVPRFFGKALISTRGKQSYTSACIIDASIDLFHKGCPSMFVDGYYDPFSECEYCYAKGSHARPALKNIYRASREHMVAEIRKARAELAEEGKTLRHLRFGKISDAGSPLCWDQLAATLEACIDAEVRPIFPTKMLGYDPALSELLRKSGASVLFSIGNDSLERGLVSQGMTNEWRFEQAMRYLAEGVNAGIYMLVDASNIDNHWFRENTRHALNLHRTHGIPIQFLPVRPPGKNLLEKITGKKPGALLMKGQQDLFSGRATPGGWIQAQNNQYVSVTIDGRILSLISEQGITMCHHNPELTWCGGCLHEEPRTLKTTNGHVPDTKKHHKPGDRRQRMLFPNGDGKKKAKKTAKKKAKKKC